MDNFTDRTHVWLWIREYEAYLVAREDGEGVACSVNRGGLHGAWAVHRLVRGGNDYVLFHSAAYGRYLAIVQGEAYIFPVQCTYDSPEQNNVLFQAVRAEDRSDDIFLRHFTFGDLCRPDDEDTAIPGPWPFHWVVEAIPARPFPPELPHPIPVNPSQLVPIHGPGIPRYNRHIQHIQLQPPQVVLRRTILYARADDQGNFNPLQWRMLEFEGQSVFKLRRDLAAKLGEANNVLDITLCVWAGSNGRRTPLVIDLPSDEKAMNIVVLTTGSPAAQELVYPNVDAP